MRIAICHQTFAPGDAIGRDIAGMCAALATCGHDPFVLCECNAHGSFPWKVSHDFGEDSIRSVELFIYHHSQDWLKGRDLLERTPVPVVFKYHNITPPYFFSGYASEYEGRCLNGELLTRHLVRRSPPHIWLCDSHYNRDQLLHAGCDLARTHVVPPFNNTQRLLASPNTATTDATKIRFLFVGRFAPNKAHRHLVRVVEAYHRLFGPHFELVIVGAIDPKLQACWDEFTSLVRQLDLGDQIRVYPHAPDAAVHELFIESHVYLCFSEHEGFCVPVIEAQAVGLPVVGSGATAVSETAGPGQFLGTPPITVADYEFYAELAHLAARDVTVRAKLVLNGHRNVQTRFFDDIIENALIEATIHWLLPHT